MSLLGFCNGADNISLALKISHEMSLRESGVNCEDYFYVFNLKSLNLSEKVSEYIQKQSIFTSRML